MLTSAHRVPSSTIGYAAVKAPTTLAVAGLAVGVSHLGVDVGVRPGQVAAETKCIHEKYSANVQENKFSRPSNQTYISCT